MINEEGRDRGRRGVQRDDGDFDKARRSRIDFDRIGHLGLDLPLLSRSTFYKDRATARRAPNSFPPFPHFPSSSPSLTSAPHESTDTQLTSAPHELTDTQITLPTPSGMTALTTSTSDKKKTSTRRLMTPRALPGTDDTRGEPSLGVLRLSSLENQRQMAERV
ncbi:hypothetical protein BDN72DRAFT_904438 [Pluteus cervinus]|uniref:Uncharacterized protein n=1 Tax=Pluteus cervinus TaxID=181527 RepID=A0ACD3A5X1_9AGAR|nr:hypothetical protein BDN72DRAFT_904438 [Pluteus cervinus]